MSYNFNTLNSTIGDSYLLGLMCANEQITDSGKTHWLMPIRHNPNHYTLSELNTHLSSLKQIYNDFELLNHWQLLGYTFPKYNAGKNGIVGLAYNQNISSIDELSDYIDDFFLINTLNSYKRSFLVGIFDGRSSFDPYTGYLVLDITGLPDALINKIDNYLLSFGITTNLNDSFSARKRSNGCLPRQPQLRVKNSEVFLEKIGLISEIRLNKSHQGLVNLGKISTSLTLTPDPLLHDLKILK